MQKVLRIVTIVAVLVVAGWLAYASGVFAPAAITKKSKVVGALYLRQHLDAYYGLKQGMKDLGYTNQDVTYDEVMITPSPNFYKDVEEGAKKLIADKVDLLWVSMEHQAATALKLTKEAGNDTPTVFMTRFHDPLDYQLVASYKSSGNNSTGVATNLFQIVQKTLSFFKEINPRAKKIGFFGQGFMIPGFGDVYASEFKKQAPKLGMAIVEYTSDKAPDPTGAVWHEAADKIAPGDIDGIVHIAGHFYDPQETAETELAKRLHIPLAVPTEDLPTGGTYAFSDDMAASAAQSGVMIDKIFKGTKPSDIPIEFGAKSILMLNLKRANEAGITFPDAMLSIAEVKIEK